MKYLFNSRGQHIANLVGDQLHAPTGENIGHYLSDEKFFIGMSGRYLGEILYDDRLMFNRATPHRSTNFGVYGNYGNTGNYGNPGNHGSIGAVGGYDDVAADWLR
jgi:hypothetical protein